MNARRLTVTALIWLVVVGLFAGIAQAAPISKDKKEQKQPEKVFIPPPVKVVMQEGLATRQGRQDIPFTIIKNYIFPAAQNLHSVYLFKVKNSDLGFAPATPATPAAPAAPAAQPAAAQPPAAQPPAGQTPPAPALQAKVNIFLQFFQVENGVPGKLFREVYVPGFFQEDPATYNPDKEEWYSTGYPMPAGNYLMAMAITSPDLKKIGVVYCDVALPDSASLQNTLETTPIIFVKKMEQMQAVETKTEVHKGFFTYSVLQIVPNIECIVSQGQNIEILFYIFGTKLSAEQKSSIEVSYEVKQGDKTAIRWANQNYDFALVSQPLPLKQTVLIKNDKGEHQETRDLAPGKYSLVINITDKTGGTKVAKTIDFEVQ
jgi:hypothetical protein